MQYILSPLSKQYLLIKALQDWHRYLSRVFSLKLAWLGYSEVGLKVKARGIDSFSRNYEELGQKLAVVYI